MELKMTSSRSTLLVVLAALSTLATATQAFADNPVQGRWSAQLPGGAVTYYHFRAGTVEPDGTIQGRFEHMYLDEHGERVLHGTYVLAPFGPWGRWGKLTLLFDNGLKIKDVEHREPGVLKLHHVGLGRVVTYHRQ